MVIWLERKILPFDRVVSRGKVMPKINVFCRQEVSHPKEVKTKV